jgi:hypothetical protein
MEDFPKENEWQDLLSRTATTHVKLLHIKGQTLKCTLVRTAIEVAHLQYTNWDYLLKFVAENTFFYLRPRLDLDGSQIEG